MNKEGLMTVNTVAKLTGITVRTLHHYDKIGLLSPSSISDTKYRFYSEDDLEKLQQILFYKEVGFELKDIKEMMDTPDYSKEQALQRHKNLLLLKRKRLDKLITLVDQTLKGEGNMSFQEFSEEEIMKLQKSYYKEASERWKDTPAFKEYEERHPNGGDSSQWKKFQEHGKKIFEKIYSYIDQSPSSPEVQAAVHEWRSFITDNYYDCTIEIFRNLGLMYVADERFKENINSYGDERLANFVSEAIAVYCDKIDSVKS